MWLCGFFLLTVTCTVSCDVVFGTSYNFVYNTHLLHGDVGASSYQIRANTVIEKILPNLFSVQLNDLKLYYKSKETGHYQEAKSVLDSSENNGFFIEISDGVVKFLYVPDSEAIHMVNLKKSFSSLLQFQVAPGQRVETDVSGKCEANYKIQDSMIQKIKANCVSDFSEMKNDVWGVEIIPQRSTDIRILDNKVTSINYQESFSVRLSTADFIETIVSTEISLIFEKDLNRNKKYEYTNIQTVINEAGNKIGKEFVKHGLKMLNLLDRSDVNSPVKLSSLLKENLSFLVDRELGSKNSAIAALRLIKVVKSTSSKEIFSALKSKSNTKIVGQLLDILGAVQTSDSHEAAMKFLNMTSQNPNRDLCERYLWALSTSSNHEKTIITDLLNIAKHDFVDKKLFETLIQTISSMLRKYVGQSNDEELLDKTLKFLLNNLKSCEQSDDLCQRIYIKAFTNVGSPKVSSVLLDHVLSGSRSVSVRAMKALQKLGSRHWTEDVLKIAERVYLSNDSFDSSAKVIALDILLETSNTVASYAKLIHILKKKSISNELKEILLQRLTQISDKCEEAKQLIKSAFTQEKLYHYNSLAQGGLSTAFDRRFMRNGYLSTAQEVKSGLLKQGYVHINLEKKGLTQTVFSLGLFSNGLSSFVSDEEREDGEDEGTNAGLELTVHGVEFRPFVFFDGHGELMGHVFSSTASTLTPAYQALILLNDEESYIPLGTGEFLFVSIMSVVSVDLSGKIEISLWSRAAESLVQNRAGLLIEKTVGIVSPYFYVSSKVKLSAEPQLKLSSDIQFSNKVALCLQLDQPETTIQYNSSVSANLVGSSFKRKKIKCMNTIIPGKTYSLNAKNNEMCKALYS